MFIDRCSRQYLQIVFDSPCPQDSPTLAAAPLRPDFLNLAQLIRSSKSQQATATKFPRNGWCESFPNHIAGCTSHCIQKRFQNPKKDRKGTVRPNLHHQTTIKSPFPAGMREAFRLVDGWTTPALSLCSKAPAKPAPPEVLPALLLPAPWR